MIRSAGPLKSWEISVKENSMELLKNVSKPKENWSESLLGMGMSNVIAHLNETRYDLIELRLLAPYFAPSREIMNQHINDFDNPLPMNMVEEYMNFHQKVSVQMESLTDLVYQLLVPKVPAYAVGLFKRYNAICPKIYMDDYQSGIDHMFADIKSDITKEESKARKTYIIYLIDTQRFKDIDFESKIPYKNYIAF